jgi:hypothetical protein
MRLRMIAIAAILAAGPAVAFAQSSPAPANQSGGGTSATTPSPTDPSTAGQTGNTKGEPARGTMTAPSGTTGSGAMGRENRMDRDNTSVPGQGVDKDDTTRRAR